MEYGISDSNAFPVLKVRLEKGERFISEPGAMVYMKGVRLISSLKGGVFSVLKRKFFGKEDIFWNVLECVDEKGEFCLSPFYLGGIAEVGIFNNEIYAKPGSFLGAFVEYETFKLEGEVSNLPTFFAFKDISFLKLKGNGMVFLSGLGGIDEIVLDDDEIVVDTGHVLAYEGSLDMKIRSVGPVRSFLFSREGFVCLFRGSGKIWIHNRNDAEFIAYVDRMLAEFKGASVKK